MSKGQGGRDLEPAMIKELLANQSKELDIRREDLAIRQQEVENEQKQRNREYDLQQQEIKNNKELALKHIEAHKGVLDNDLEYSDKQNKRSYIFWGTLSVLVIAFLLVSMYMGKEDFAETIIKMLVGAVGGYFIGISKSKSEELEQLKSKDKD